VVDLGLLLSEDENEKDSDSDEYFWINQAEINKYIPLCSLCLVCNYCIFIILTYSFIKRKKVLIAKTTDKNKKNTSIQQKLQALYASKELSHTNKTGYYDTCSTIMV
jgi:hypothetical protein